TAVSRFSLSTALWGLGGLLLTTGAVSAGWHAGHRSVRLLQPREIPLTTNSPAAPVDGVAISTAGHLLVYVDKMGMHQKDTASGETHAVTLPADFMVTWASWFPDQNHILASAATESSMRTGLWKISLLGGTPQKLMEDAELGRVSPDGKKIAFMRGDFPR